MLEHAAALLPSTKSPGEAQSRCGPPRARMSCQTITRRSGSGRVGAGAARPATIEKIAVLAPMPSARAASAAAIGPGARRQAAGVADVAEQGVHVRDAIAGCEDR